MELAPGSSQVGWETFFPSFAQTRLERSAKVSPLFRFRFASTTMTSGRGGRHGARGPIPKVLTTSLERGRGESSSMKDPDDNVVMTLTLASISISARGTEEWRSGLSTPEYWCIGL